jgi:type IV pilus assembly protein PilM
LLREKTQLGLDIGEKRIKLVMLKKEGNMYRVTAYGSMKTPPGTVDGGVISDPARLGEALRGLVQKTGINPNSPLASAVSGQQVYTRLLSLPRMRMEELRQAALFQAAGFLPLSIDDVTADIYPVREYSDADGHKTEVLFVATRTSQVDSLLEACRIAGLKLRWVEIEALGLARVFYPQLTSGGAEIKAVVNIGASRAYIAFYKKALLVLLRSITFGSQVFYESDDEQAGAEITPGVDASSPEFPELMGDFVAEMSRSLSYAQIQLKEPVNTLFLTGGGSRIAGMADYLAQALQVQCSLGELGAYLKLPAEQSPQARELRHDFPVALGLALRGWF